MLQRKVVFEKYQFSNIMFMKLFAKKLDFINADNKVLEGIEAWSINVLY